MPNGLKFSGKQTFKKGERTQLSDHFYSDEFDCHCNNLECIETIIDMDVVDRCERLRSLRGKGFSPNSGFRCKKHNAAIGGGTDSKHLTGEAVDIDPDGHVRELLWFAHLFNGVGDGPKANPPLMHGDTRKDKEFAFWTY